MLTFGSKFTLFLIQILLVVVHDEAARILCIYPMPSISHQVVFRPVTLELAKRGHEVVVLTPDPAFPKGGAPKNLKEIDVHDMSYKSWREMFVKKVSGSEDINDQLLEVVDTMIEMFVEQMQTEEARKYLSADNHYDLILAEGIFNLPAALAHVFNAPIIRFSSFGSLPYGYRLFGAPTHPIIFPNIMSQRPFNLTFVEKINAFQEDHKLTKMVNAITIKEQVLLEKLFGQEMPKMNDLMYEADLFFLNLHPIWDNNRPVPPNVIYLGGLHLQPQKKLPTDFKSFLDSSKNGVIYMSFGTNVDPSLLPKEKIQIFCNVFSKLPYDILWKWDNENIHCKPDNVKVSKWIPQADLLKHPKVKLFITQAGLQSTDESILAGVPLIAFPLLGDQWYNAEQYVRLGIGQKKAFQTITEDDLEKSIKEVIEDPSYKNSIKWLSEIIRDQPETPLQRAIWWAEYTIRHRGAKHLRSPLVKMSWAEYLVLDVVAIVLGVAVTTLIVAALILKKVVKFVNQSTKLKSN